MKCEICGKEILRDSQCINYKYYHNDCIEDLQQENKRLLKTITHNEKCRRKMQKSLMSIIEKQKEVIDKANKKLNNFIDCCKAEKLESGSDYIHHQYWDMFERFNKQIKDILKEVSE